MFVKILIYNVIQIRLVPYKSIITKISNYFLNILHIFKYFFKLIIVSIFKLLFLTKLFFFLKNYSLCVGAQFYFGKKRSSKYIIYFYLRTILELCYFIKDNLNEFRLSYLFNINGYTMYLVINVTIIECCHHFKYINYPTLGTKPFLPILIYTV